MKQNKKLIYVGFSFAHMGKHTGYDLIRNHVNYDLFIDCQKSFNWKDRLLKKKSLIKKVYLKFIGPRLWWIELYLIYLAITKRNLVFHIIYPENIYKYLGIFKGKTHEVVCTYHQPREFMVSNPQYFGGIKKVDKIIVLSAEEVQKYEELVGKKNVYFLPHGVDTHYFKPSNLVSKSNSILMVGNWLRDFDFANDLFQLLLNRQRELKINVVASSFNLSKFAPRKNLHLLSNISDDELLRLYQETAILFLPLSSFVANNALLEGAACGCNIIIATDNSASNYFEEELVKVYPLKKELLVNDISKLLIKSSNHKKKIVKKVQESYSWERIGKLTEELLRS